MCAESEGGVRRFQNSGLCEAGTAIGRGRLKQALKNTVLFLLVAVESARRSPKSFAARRFPCRTYFGLTPHKQQFCFQDAALSQELDSRRSTKLVAELGLVCLQPSPPAPAGLACGCCRRDCSCCWYSWAQFSRCFICLVLFCHPQGHPIRSSFATTRQSPP